MVMMISLKHFPTSVIPSRKRTWEGVTSARVSRLASKGMLTLGTSRYNHEARYIPSHVLLEAKNICIS